MDLRNLLYDLNLLPSHSLGARTISIGNLTTGGTGKTPLVAFTAGLLAESGSAVCILSRGYGRQDPKNRVLVSDGTRLQADPRTGGDEPFELARRLIGKAMVIADGNRVAAAIWAKERFNVTVFILDDAFQHRRARRDVDVLCIDATNPWGNGRILPAGPLREAQSGIRRADAAVITRAELVEDTDHIQEMLRDHGLTGPIFLATSSRMRLTRLDDFTAGRTAVEEHELTAPAFVFTAIGNPSSFHAQLERSKIAIAGITSFRDHHSYRQRDADAVVQGARAFAASYLLTTAKDAVKLSDLNFEMPVFVVESETELNDIDRFRALIVGKGLKT